MFSVLLQMLQHLHHRHLLLHRTCRKECSSEHKPLWKQLPLQALSAHQSNFSGLHQLLSALLLLLPFLPLQVLLQKVSSCLLYNLIHLISLLHQLLSEALLYQLLLEPED